MTDARLEQYVCQPTRQNNMLDLVFSTHPRLSNLEIIPGFSDHDAIIFNKCNEKFAILQSIGIIAIKSNETRSVIYTCRYSSQYN